MKPSSASSLSLHFLFTLVCLLEFKPTDTHFAWTLHYPFSFFPFHPLSHTSDKEPFCRGCGCHLCIVLWPRKRGKWTVGTEVWAGARWPGGPPPPILRWPSSHGPLWHQGQEGYSKLGHLKAAASNCFAPFMRAVEKRREHVAAGGTQSFSSSAANLVRGVVLPLKPPQTSTRLSSGRISFFCLTQ